MLKDVESARPSHLPFFESEEGEAFSYVDA